jgi:hypothetical protein
MYSSYMDQLPNCYTRLCYVQSLKMIWKDGSTDLDPRPYLLRSVRCLLFLCSESHDASDVGIIFQELCWEFSMPVLDYL